MTFPELTEHKSLEDLFKEHWTQKGTWANNCLMLYKTGEMMIYDTKTEEIVIRYSTEIKK
jgi:hypothetical protein